MPFVWQLKVSEKSREAYNACRQITFCKNPGARPFGIGEFLGRIIVKCIIKCIENNLRFLGGNTPGQECGIRDLIQSLLS